ncbi:unnamed protein product [Leptosia nina]|uniref:Uncharacterized protein n=1 Tax=Leptosia nina TaxID=320188 RepID=A0AAV1JCA3_9NEOP
MLKLLFCVLFLAGVRAESKREYVKISQAELPRIMETSLTCITETNADADTLQKLLTLTLNDSENVKKFLYCFLNRGGYAENTGHIIMKNVIPFVQNHRKRNEFISVLEECNRLNGKNKYETIFKISTCVRDKTPIIFTI